MGNIKDILDQVNPSNNRTHTYDVLQRLKTGGTATNAESYEYDLVGNRTTSFLSSNHNHDDLNRLLEDDQFTYTYDANGNLETKTDKASPTDVTTYHWDAQDQLIQVDLPDGSTVTYKYDGLGRRIEKAVAGSVTRYVYDGEDILLEYDGTNTFLARYSHGDQVDQPLMLQKAGVGHFYYHSNHQGSITHLTDGSGVVANSYIYDSYGRRSNVIESVIQPYSYTGREYDDESGLYYYRARYYDPVLGRFLSEDPIGFNAGDQNFYRYVLNNPVNLIDATGRQATNSQGGSSGKSSDHKVYDPTTGKTYDLQNPSNNQKGKSGTLQKPKGEEIPKKPRRTRGACRAIFEGCLKGAVRCPGPPGVKRALAAACAALYLACLSGGDFE